MRIVPLLLLASLLGVVLAGCSGPSGTPEVRFETSLGDFTVELWPDEAPKTVENFLRYVEDGHFDGLTFHRIAPGFVVQGGGYLPDHETLRPTRAPIVNEASPDVRNEKWTLSMARTNAPNSATSQFFINLADNAALDKTAQSAGYAVFGKVVSGFETVEAMTEVEPGQSFGAGGFFPKEPIVIHKATQISGSGPEPLAPPTPADVRADLVTPGTWSVTNTEDAILAWAINDGGTPTDHVWQLTGPDRTALPEGWEVSFDDPDGQIGATGTVASLAHTMVRLTVPTGTAGQFPVELHTGISVTPVTVSVDLMHDRISGEGDAVTANYAGSCTADGQSFESGQFPLTLGGGRAIIGFDLGLVGLGLGEEATLVLPAPLAYGESGGPCAGLAHAGLTFVVSIDSFDD